jgi:hypothetical protein
MTNKEITIGEIAEITGKGYSTVWRILKRGKLKPTSRIIEKHKPFFFYNYKEVKKLFKIIEVPVETYITKDVYVNTTFHIYESKMNYDPTI